MVRGILVLALAGLLACAKPTRVAEMTPAEIPITTQHPHSLSTSVTGGEDTSPLGASKISDESFKSALEAAVLQSKVFSDVISLDGADYKLEVVITNHGFPLAGFDMSVTLTTHWTLTSRDQAEPVWQGFVSSKYTARTSDHFYGVARLRMANEGAARENIKKGIQRLSELEL